MATRGPSRASSEWTRRVALGAIAFSGSAAYAWSFRDAEIATERLALAIAVAAGVSWLALGGAILATTRARPSVLAWADACLATMGVGIAVLLASVLLNLAGVGTTPRHAGVLLVSNALMALVFARRASRLGMRPPLALALWILALDAPFLVLVWVLA